MSIESGIGVSLQAEIIPAVTEAARKAKEQCPTPSVVLVFITHNYPLDSLLDASKAVSSLFPAGTSVAGGTVNGVTYGADRYDAVFANAYAVAVLALGGENLTIGLAIEPHAEDGKAIGKRLAQTVKDQIKCSPEGGLVFTPGFSQGFPLIDQEILNGIRSVEPRLRLAGTGFAGGMDTQGMPTPGFAFLGDRLEHLGSLLLVIQGDFSCGFSMANGMKPYGPGGFVTETEGPFISKISGKPAKEAVLDLLCMIKPEGREHFAKNPAVACVEHGVVLASPDPEGDFYWGRAINFFTEDGKAGDSFVSRKGTALALVSIDKESCMGAVKQAVDMLVEDTGTSEFDCVLAFSCLLRGFTLGPDVAHEDQELRNHVTSKKHLGLIANGEIGCYRHGRPFSAAWVYALFGISSEGRR